MADADASSTEQAAPAPTGLKAKLPLALAVIIGLAVGAGTGAVVVGPVAAKSLGFTATAAARPDAGDDHGDNEDTADDSATTTTTPAVFTLDNLVLNPAESGGARFLLLTVAMECRDAAAVSALQARDAELRDVVLSTLGRKTVDELAAIAGRDSIKTELTAALNERFGKKSVLRVYFPQYVVQ